MKVCMMGKFHNVLYIGMKVAWEWGVTDSVIIKELLGMFCGILSRIFFAHTYANEEHIRYCKTCLGNGYAHSYFEHNMRTVSFLVF